MLDFLKMNEPLWGECEHIGIEVHWGGKRVTRVGEKLTMLEFTTRQFFAAQGKTVHMVTASAYKRKLKVATGNYDTNKEVATAHAHEAMEIDPCDHDRAHDIGDAYLVCKYLRQKLDK